MLQAHSFKVPKCYPEVVAMKGSAQGGILWPLLRNIIMDCTKYGSLSHAELFRQHSLEVQGKFSKTLIDIIDETMGYNASRIGLRGRKVVLSPPTTRVHSNYTIVK